LKRTQFQDWLAKQRESSQVQILDYWQQIVPLQPTLPSEIEQVLQQFNNLSTP
jgi:hypothetical protein